MQRNLYIIFFIVFAVASFGQQRVETSIDTTRNKIGAQFNLTLKTDVDTLSNVTFPSGDRFGQLEVIRNYVVDTTRKGDRYELIKRYGLTQFDSGQYTIPQLKVIVNNRTFLTDSILLEIDNVAVDTLEQQMFDIKPIMGAASQPFPEWIKYILIFLLIIAVGVVAYFIIKRRQQKSGASEQFKTPIERATTLLQILENKELWQKGEVKAYYSELTDIARNYIEEAIHIPAMESTTSELIAGLRAASQQKKMPVSQETLVNLEKVLMHADLVKFAKSKPLDYEIAEDRSRIENTLMTLDKAIPEVVEEDIEEKEAIRRKRERKERLIRILVPAGIVLVLCFGTLVYFIATHGFTYVKDTIIGHPTKELLEGEWVYSEYGHPAIGMETPRVLKREPAEKHMGPEMMAIYSHFQMFVYGSLMENFTVMASTMTFKSEVEIDLNKAVEGGIRGLEARGAQNILVKQEEYETREGISGIKAYGTFTAKHPTNGKTTKMYYEILMFGQENGLQQVIIMHEEGDGYAKAIMERILSSVELKKLNSYE